MARMIPPKYRPTPSEAEKNLFELFKKDLPQDYTVFHGLRWFLRDKLELDGYEYIGDKDGEGDFIILHPAYGLLVLEVKGGRISYDGIEDEWKSQTNNGSKEYILDKSPFQQAMKTRMAFKKLLEKEEKTRYITWQITRAVAFPDAPHKHINFGPEATRETLLDYDDCQSGKIEQAIKRAYGKSPRVEIQIGEHGVKVFVEWAAPQTNAPEIPLTKQIEDNKRTFEKLNEEQIIIYEATKLHTRICIAGFAGSGKTWLAMQIALDQAEAGRQVLYTCFNRFLSEMVRAKLKTKPQSASIKVSTFHSLCTSYARQFGENLDYSRIRELDDPEAEKNEANEEYFNKTLPDKLSEILQNDSEILPEIIIIDEGQDFDPYWFLILEEALKSRGEKSRFYIFYDDSQNINKKNLELPNGMVLLHLTRNCRNTVPIHKKVVEYYSGALEHSCHGPEGVEVTYIKPDGKPDGQQLILAEAECLRKLLYQLTVEQQVKTRDITVLTYWGSAKSPYKEGKKLGNITLTWNWSVDFDAVPANALSVRISTIRKFKGLESPIIILLDFECFKKLDSEDQKHYLYTAISRANTAVYIIGESL